MVTADHATIWLSPCSPSAYAVMDFWSMPVSCAIARRSLAESSVVLVEKIRSGAQFSVCWI